MTLCTCKVGPGKFEAEPIATFIAYDYVMNGASDETVGKYEFFRFPLKPDCDAKRNARDYGYCDVCIASVDTDDVYGIAVWESDQGFVYGEWLNTESEWNKAIATAEEEANEEEGNE